MALIDGQVTLFDCIEFNPELRWIDSISEVAFVAMDLHARGYPRHCWRFLNRYFERSGDYAGIAGIQELFQKLGGLTQGTFRSEPQSIAAHGDELVVTHVRNTLQMQGTRIEFDAVVVWRVVDQQIREAWTFSQSALAPVALLLTRDLMEEV